MIKKKKKYYPIESSLTFTIYLVNVTIATALITAKGLDVNYRNALVEKQSKKKKKKKKKK